MSSPGFNPPPTAPTFNPFGLPPTNSLTQQESDELFARKLQQEENDAAAAAAAARSSITASNNPSFANNYTNSNPGQLEHKPNGVFQATVVEGYMTPQGESQNRNENNYNNQHPYANPLSPRTEPEIRVAPNMPSIQSSDNYYSGGAGAGAGAGSGTVSGTGIGPNHQMMSDAELARKVQREIQDEMYARQLQEYERRRNGATRGQVHPNNRSNNNGNNHNGNNTANVRISSNQQQLYPVQRRSRCTPRRWCTAIFMLIIVAGSAVLVLLYGSTIWERLQQGGELPPFFSWDETGDTPPNEGFKSWKTNGKGGLKLTVVNAMTSDWDQYLSKAVADWNEAPALELSLEVAANPDPPCALIAGKLKACNDEYGVTGWSGLNEAYLDSRGTITASTAKMNESYLKRAKYEERLYVVCHELGHGYGLPHRDTNANNIDLGTCLDYTTLYRNNMQPDEVDFQNLQNLYGTIGNRRQLDESGIVHENLSSLRKSHNDRSNVVVPATRHSESYKNGRLLLKSEHKEIYEEKLSDGGKIITTLLLAR